MSNHIKENIICFAHKLAEEKLVTAWDGNLSGRTTNGFWITPTHHAKEMIDESQLLLMKWDGSYDTNNDLRPSIEWRFHEGIYKACPQAQYVFHAHPFYLMLVSDEDELWEQSVLGDEMPNLTKLPRIDHYPAGSQVLAEKIAEKAEGKTNALMIKKHGIISWSDDPYEAFYTIAAFERYAKAIVLKHLIKASYHNKNK